MKVKTKPRNKTPTMNIRKFLATFEKTDGENKQHVVDGNQVEQVMREERRAQKPPENILVLPNNDVEPATARSAMFRQAVKIKSCTPSPSPAHFRKLRVTADRPAAQCTDSAETELNGTETEEAL